MNQKTDLIAASSVALKTFLRIADAWNLEEGQRLELLGVSDLSRIWSDNAQTVLTDQTMERISYTMGVYKNLRLIFPTEDQANAWIKKPNRDFDGEPALRAMIENPVIVRKYLDYFAHN